MSSIVEWVGTLERSFLDVSSNESGKAQVEIKLTRKGLEIVKLDMKESYYTFEMCAKAATAWIVNNPGDPEHAIKIVNDTLNNYRDKIEAKGDRFYISMKDYR